MNQFGSSLSFVLIKVKQKLNTMSRSKDIENHALVYSGFLKGLLILKAIQVIKY